MASCISSWRGAELSTLFEDLEPGQEFLSHARTITEVDIGSFASLSGDYNALHTDDRWVRDNTPFRGRIAHGVLILAIAEGLRTPGLDELEVIAFLHVERSFAAPTYPGDTIRARWAVQELRESRSRPEAGVVTLRVDVTNQDGAVVQRGTDVDLVARRR